MTGSPQGTMVATTNYCAVGWLNWRTLACALVVAALGTACSDDGSFAKPEDLERLGPPSTTAPEITVPKIDPPLGCVIQSDCFRDQADVDGDSQGDRIGVFASDCDDLECTLHLRVVTATGKGREATVPDAAASALEYLGSGNIDGRPGAEILAFVDGGEHSRSVRIWTWRGDDLAVVMNDGEESLLFTDGGLNSLAGITCGADAAGPFVQTFGGGPDDSDLHEPRTWYASTQVLRFDTDGDLHAEGPPTQFEFVQDPIAEPDFPKEAAGLAGVNCPSVRDDRGGGPPLPTLGIVWANAQSGWGEVAPGYISNGGDGTGIVFHTAWEDWGQAQAFGRGTRYTDPRDEAGAVRKRVTVVAYALGDCHGQRAYRAYQWLDDGEQFDPTRESPYDICPPDGPYSFTEATSEQLSG